MATNFVRQNPSDLWRPPGGVGASEFKKATPPKLGPAFGSWAGRDLTYLNLPGGAVMQFDLSKLTLADYRQMRSHYQINACLSILTFMLHQIDWQVECEDQKIADLIEENLDEVWTRLIRAMSQAFWAGYSPCVLQWDNNATTMKIELTKIKDLPPEDCRVNWKTVEGYAPPNHARPKFYEYDGLVQIPGVSYEVPAENTLWYPLLMENGDFYGRKLLNSAFQPWFFSTLIHLFSNRYFERFGEPLPIGRAAFEDQVDVGGGEVINGREAMENILQNFRNRSVVVLPSDREQVGDSGRSEYTYDIQYLESQMRGADFERYLSRLDEEMSLSVFTPLLMMRTADQGSQALGTMHAQVYLWMLNALAGDLKEYIDRYIITRIKDFNFGPNAPKAKWVPRKLGKENVETFRAVVQELVRGGRVKPDVEELGTAIGLSLEEVKNVTELPPPPASAADPRIADPQKDVADNDAKHTADQAEKAQEQAVAVAKATPAPVVAPANGPQKDPRIARQGNPGKRPGPRSTGDPTRTGRKISARVKSQFAAAKKRNDDEFVADLGHRSQMEQELGPEYCDMMYATLGKFASEMYHALDSVERFDELFNKAIEVHLAEDDA